MEEMKIPDLLLLDENSSFPLTSQKSAVLYAVAMSQLEVGSRSSIPTSQKWIAPLIVLIASLITAMVQLVRFQNIFKDQQSIFEGFVLSNAIAFSSSFSSLFLANKPGLARFCVFCSGASMASAVTLLLYAATYTQTSA